MDRTRIEELLRALVSGQATIDEVLARLRNWPILDLGHSQLDTQRELRCGHAEVVFGAGKAPGELLAIARAHLEHHDRLLVTRCSDEASSLLVRELSRAQPWPRCRAVTVQPAESSEGVGLVAIVSAGTSDAPVAEEAAVTARLLGARVDELRDVGVAGIHRLLAHLPRLRQANAVVVVAGMEGALPSVVGGLVDRPVIAVPTSVGYGASFGGLAALLSMLNTCAAGVTTVNIDNGFGGGFAAASINRLAVSARKD